MHFLRGLRTKLSFYFLFFTIYLFIIFFISEPTDFINQNFFGNKGKLHDELHE